MSTQEDLVRELVSIKGSQDAAAAAIADVAGDVSELRDSIADLTARLEAEAISPETLELARQLSRDSAELASTAQDAANLLPESEPEEESEPTDPELS